MSRRRVLFLAADTPWPPDGGGRIASLNVLEAFSRQFDVDLLALADPFRPLDLSHLKSLCRRVEIVPHPFTFGRHPVRQSAVAIRSLASLEPYRLRKFRNRAFSRVLAEWTAEGVYDLIHHEQFGVTPYLDPRIPSTAMVQNVESQIYRLGQQGSGFVSRSWAMIEGAKLARREPELLKQFDSVFVLTDADRRALNSVDVGRVTVVPMPAPPARPLRPLPASPAILSLGSMSWFGVADGLAWFHDLVLPRIRAQVPEATWILVGPGAPRAVRDFVRDPSIKLVGYVDDVAPFVESARIAIVPLRIAGGIRMKLLDLMAWGVPSVATELGAQGIGFDDGDGCFRRDDPDAFAKAAINLLSDDELWRATVVAGRRYIEQHHSPGNLDAAILTGVEDAIRRHAAEGTDHG